MVVVEGLAGIGKSRLLRLARDQAAAAGIMVLQARGSELERDFTFGVVRQLLERVVRAASGTERERLFGGSAALAAGLLLDRPEAPAGPDATFALLNGLSWVLGNLAEVGPLVLVVDDLQWADDASQRFAAFAAARLAGLPVGLVTAVRTGEGVLAEPVLALTLHPDTRVVRPAALSAAGVGKLVEHALGPADPEFAGACVTATGGIPFYVNETVSQLARDSVPPTAANTGRIGAIHPESLARSVVARIGHLSRDAVAIAQALAVLGDTASEELAADLAGVDRSEARRAVAGMRSIGVLAADRLAFAHPIMGTAVSADIADAVRAEAHGRAALLLRDAGADLERVSAQLLRAPAGACGWGGRLAAAVGA